jgi:hypothetical protein
MECVSIVFFALSTLAGAKHSTDPSTTNQLAGGDPHLLTVDPPANDHEAGHPSVKHEGSFNISATPMLAEEGILLNVIAVQIKDDLAVYHLEDNDLASDDGAPDGRLAVVDQRLGNATDKKVKCHFFINIFFCLTDSLA